MFLTTNARQKARGEPRQSEGKREDQGGNMSGGKTQVEEHRNNFDLQMRLTRTVPSVSLPLCQAKISGSTPEAE